MTAGPKLISVVMAVRDAEQHVGEQLAALAGQTYRGDWELLVVDNGSTDRSLEIANGWRDRIPSLRIVDASDRRGLSHARNAGVAAARGELALFCDADDVATPGWVEAMASAAATADIVGGALDFDALNHGPPRRWCDWDPPTELHSHHDFLPYAAGGNCAMWTSVAREVGWDESFAFGSTDMEFCWRAQLAGHELRFASSAIVQQRFKDRLSSLARQFYAYGRSDPQVYRRFRAHGMPRPRAGEAGTWRWIVSRAPDLLRGPAARGRWVRTAARACGRLVGSLRFRVVVL